MRFKKISLILLIVLATNFIGGCVKRDTLDNIDIYTTVYPLEYITNYLYGARNNIYSIYPDGIIITEYDLTEKQIQDYSKGSIFVYNGLLDEKKYVQPMFNHNRNLRIIDASRTMEYSGDIHELWLNPSNFLMLAQNIRNGLKEYINNGYLKDEIDKNYEELKVEVSNLDAKIQLTSDSASNKTIITSNPSLRFLEKYGFKVLVANNNLTDRQKQDIKDLYENKLNSHIFLLQNDDENEFVQELMTTFEIEIVYLYDLSNISEEQRGNNQNYLTIMNENIELLKLELYN